jgi:D-arabinose 1-dehydrogenase-like Zn-dependent alcohol dehydrogenase
MENSNGYNHGIYKKATKDDCDAIAYAFISKDKAEHYPFKFPELKSNEIRANILYAGLCMSDSHTARELWGPTNFPLAPGHEIIAEVSQIGSDVKNFKVGQKVGFGTIRNSCAECKYCKKSNEAVCIEIDPSEKFTYGKYWGGYATQLQHPAKFFFPLPDNFDLKRGSPLLCAGITVYKPIKNHVRKGDKCAVIGVGGLGHLAVQFLAKMGYEVTGITTSSDKTEFIKKLGATDVLVSTDKQQMAKHKGKYDFIVNTVPATSDIEGYISLCAPEARFIQVGIPENNDEFKLHFYAFVPKDIEIIGSLTGGIDITQDMIEFCAKNDVYPIVEEFSFEDFGKAFDRLENGRPKFRCVVDVQTYSKKNNLFK